jgi:hypothetical protein
MSFPWLDRTPVAPAGADSRLAAQLRELRDRAALLYRLGYTADAASARLCATVAWEHETQRRPDGLSDAEIGKVVQETYGRRPSGEH